MKVEKVTRSEKVKDRYYLDFEDGGKLTVNIALIADYSLYAGRDLTDDEMVSLRGDAEKASARASALRMLGRRSLSRREVTDRLTRKGVSDVTAGGVADWLENIGAVDDAEYAAAIVRHYASHGYGKAKIREEFYRRGVDKELWDAALASMPETGEFIRSFLDAKLKGKKPDRAELKRVTDALFRRGFSWDEIRTAESGYFDDIEDND